MKRENLGRAHGLDVELDELGLILDALEHCTYINANLFIQTEDLSFYHDISLDGLKDKEFIELFIDHLKAKQNRMEKELEDLL